MMTNRKSAASRAVCALGGASLLLAACGGGGGGGGEDDILQTSVTISEANAARVAGAAFSLQDVANDAFDLVDDFVGGDWDFAAAVSAARSSDEDATKEKRWSLPLPRNGAEAVRSSTFAETEPCQDGGSMSIQGDTDSFSVRFDNCTFRDEVGDFWASVRLNGTLSGNTVAMAGYTDAVRFTADLRTNYQDSENDHYAESLKFDMRVGLSDPTDYIVRIDSMQVSDNGVWLGQAYDMQIAARDVHFEVKPGIEVRYGGRVAATGTDADGTQMLGGAITVDTVEPLRFVSLDGEPYDGTVVVTGAEGSALVLEFVEGGVWVTINDADPEFYAWPAFHAWAN
jgi:hypothetical protein